MTQIALKRYHASEVLADARRLGGGGSGGGYLGEGGGHGGGGDPDLQLCHASLPKATWTMHDLAAASKFVISLPYRSPCILWQL